MKYTAIRYSLLPVSTSIFTNQNNFIKIITQLGIIRFVYSVISFAKLNLPELRNPPRTSS